MGLSWRQSSRGCLSVFLFRLLHYCACFPTNNVCNLLKGTMIESASKETAIIVSEMMVREKQGPMLHIRTMNGFLLPTGSKLFKGNDRVSVWLVCISVLMTGYPSPSRDAAPVCAAGVWVLPPFISVPPLTGATSCKHCSLSDFPPATSELIMGTW